MPLSGRETSRRASCRFLLHGIASAGALLHSLLLFNQGLIDVGQVVAFKGLILLFGFPTFVQSSPIRRSPWG